jgi:hypothetical protein
VNPYMESSFALMGPSNVQAYKPPCIGSVRQRTVAHQCTPPARYSTLP